MGTNATTISAGSKPNRARRGAASYDNGLEAQNDTRPAHACVRPSCPSFPVTRTVAEEHFAFKLHLTLDSDPFHARYDRWGKLTKVADAKSQGTEYEYDILGRCCSDGNHQKR